MKSYEKCYWFLALMAVACGGSSTENINNYGKEASLTTITVVTIDQFGNPVSGRIVFNGEMIGVGEAELTFDPAQSGTIGFDSNLTDYAPPAMVDLSVNKFESGKRYRATYTRGGPVANVCPRTNNAQGNQVDANVSVNGVRVNYMAGYCQAVNTQNDTVIDSGDANGVYANSIFIPAEKLEENGWYTYDLFFGNGEKMIYVATTPISGEMFVDGRSVGWAKDYFLPIQLLPKAENEISFEDVLGYQVAKSFVVKADDVDYENNQFWGLYDAYKNALTCFSGVQDGGGAIAARVLLNNNLIETEWNAPVCVGIHIELEHQARFMKRDQFHSVDVINISKTGHVGCEGSFTPGGRLDCVGQYYYVQPALQRTEFNISLKFSGPYKDNPKYPISGRFELNGIQYDNEGWSYVMKMSEVATIQLLPVGILEPTLSKITVDTAALSEEDQAFDPEKNQWVFSIHYNPPGGAVETCVTSLNQTEMNISAEVEMSFDGVKSLNRWSEDMDCHWLSVNDNHVIVPGWLKGYQPAINQIHIPGGKLNQIDSFIMSFVPDPTSHQLCLSDVSVEVGIVINGKFIGWTNTGEVCLRLDKSRPNTITLEGVGTRSFAAQDWQLPGAYSNIPFDEF